MLPAFNNNNYFNHRFIKKLRKAGLFFVLFIFTASSINLAYYLYIKHNPNDAKAAGISATSLSLNQGTTAGGTNVTVNGSGFNPVDYQFAVQTKGGATTEGKGIVADSSGNSYVTGRFKGDVTFGSINLVSNGDLYDIYLVKYDSSGVVQWARKAGGTGDDQGNGIALDSGGNIFITGQHKSATMTFDSVSFTTTSNISSSQSFIAKYNSSGTIQDAKGLNSSHSVYGISIKIDSQDNIYFAGYFIGTFTYTGGTTLSSTNADTLLIKFTSSFSLTWAKKSIGSSNEYIASIYLDSSNNIYVTGYYSNTTSGASLTFGSLSSTTYAGSNDIFMVKYNSSGTALALKTMGSTADDQGGGITADSSGNIYATGYFTNTLDFGGTSLTTNGTNSNTMYIAKYDSSFNLIWVVKPSLTSGANSTRSVGTDIALDSTGNIYLGGQFSGGNTFSSIVMQNTYGNDTFVAKLDSTGTFIWAKNPNATRGAAANTQVALDSGNNVLSTGQFQGTAAFGSYAINAAEAAANTFTAKLDNSGTAQWAYSPYGVGEDRGQGVVLDDSSNAYTTGYFGTNMTFNNQTISNTGINSVFLAKYDSDGGIVWTKKAGGINGLGDDRAYGIAIDKSSGNIYVTGYFSSTIYFDTAQTISLTSSGGSDIFIAKYDLNGNVVWVKKAGGTSGDSASSIAVDSSGNVYVTGIGSSSMTFDSISVTADAFYLAKYNSNGTAQWVKTANAYSEGKSVATDSEGNVYVTGNFYFSQMNFGIVSISGTNYVSKMFLVKYDSSGVAQWAKSGGGSSDGGGQSGMGIAVDSSGNSFVTGYFPGSATFAPGITINSVGNTYRQPFAAKYDTSGNALWAKVLTDSITGYGTGTANTITLDQAGNIYIGAGIRGPFTVGGVSYADRNTDITVIKLDPSGNYITAKVSGAGTFGDDAATSIAVDSVGNPYVVGYFQSSFTLGPTTISAITYESFFTKFNNLKVTIGGNPASVNAVTDTSIILKTPAASGGSIGTVNVVVTNPDTSAATLSQAYTYVIPSLGISIPQTVASFSTVNVTTGVQTVSTTLSNICIDDTRESTSGWTAVVKFNNFVARNNTTQIIPLASSTNLSDSNTQKRLKVTPSLVTKVKGNIAPTSYNTQATITGLSNLTGSGISNGFSIASTAAGNGGDGAAKYCIGSIGVQLDIPAYSYADTYDSVVSVEVS